MTAKLTARFREALVYAAELHANQRRKGSGEPYIGHLFGVASLVLQHGGSENEAIAALLHDAVEDQGGRPTLQEIRRRFGKRVAAIIEGCSDAFEVPKPPWPERKEKHLRKIRRAPASVRLGHCRRQARQRPRHPWKTEERHAKAGQVICNAPVKHESENASILESGCQTVLHKSTG